MINIVFYGITKVIVKVRAMVAATWALLLFMLTEVDRLLCSFPIRSDISCDNTGLTRYWGIPLLPMAGDPGFIDLNEET